MKTILFAALFLLLAFVGKTDMDSAVVTAAIEEEVRLEAAGAAGAALAALHGERAPLTNPLDCDARMAQRGAGEPFVSRCYIKSSSQ